MSFRNFVLFLMFGGLFYGMYYLYQSQASQPLHTELISVDTVLISRLRLRGPEPKQLIELQRQEADWIASNGQVHLKALSAPVRSLLQNLLNITTIDISTTSESEWGSYGLAAEQATRVEVFKGTDNISDFYVSQPGSSATKDSLSYIRFQGETEVYAVRGLQTAPFYQTFAAFRPKTIVHLPPDSKIDSFSYVLADSSYTIKNTKAGWQFNGLTLEDPSWISRFLANIQHLSSDAFADDFDDNRAGVIKLPSLHLHPSQAEAPVLIEMYQDTLREKPYVFRSTQNPGTWFESDSAKLYQHFILPLDSLTFKPLQDD